MPEFEIAPDGEVGNVVPRVAPRLAVLKALGDNTRYAIYLELARSQSPLSTAEIADTLGLHPNTVRPHLERMREVGLLEVASEGKGTVGRPQHRYAVAPDAPSLGLEPPASPLMARMLAQVAATAGVRPELMVEAGAGEGRAMAASRPPGKACTEALMSMLSELGFDPESVRENGMVTIAFTHCPFQQLAEAHPEVVCNLHRGLVEGFLEQIGGAGVERFGALADRDPCQVELAVR